MCVVVLDTMLPQIQSEGSVQRAVDSDCWPAPVRQFRKHVESVCFSIDFRFLPNLAMERRTDGVAWAVGVMGVSARCLRVTSGGSGR